MNIDWQFIIGAAVVLGLLGLGLYACNWLSNYTTMRHEEKLQARLEEREELHRQHLQEMRAHQTKKSSAKEVEDDDLISEYEMTQLMAESVKRAEAETGATSKLKKSSKSKTKRR